MSQSGELSPLFVLGRFSPFRFWGGSTLFVLGEVSQTGEVSPLSILGEVSQGAEPSTLFVLGEVSPLFLFWGRCHTYRFGVGASGSFLPLHEWLSSFKIVSQIIILAPI